MNGSSSGSKKKRTYVCPAGCGWSKTNWGDLLRHIAMSKDALHSDWRMKQGLPAQPFPLGDKRYKNYFWDVKIALLSVLWAKKK